MREKITAGIALFLLLMSVYLLTYRGLPMSGDEIFIYDSATSFAQRGDLYRVYEYNTVVSPPNRLIPNADGSPWLQPVQEPLMAVLISPLLGFARAIDGIGTMHIVWLFNLVITALTAISLYAIALQWGYSIRVAWVLGLSYGIATNAWFYGRLLFREPITGLFLLWAFAAAFTLQKAWGSRRIPYRTGALLIVSFGLAFLTKVASLLFLPALLIVLLPPLSMIWKRWRMVSVLVGLMFVCSIFFILIMSNSDLGQRYALSTWTQRLTSIQWAYVLESILGYQFSLGRSLWLYSPILLAGLFGARRLIGEGEWRLVAGVVVTLLLLSAWYGIALTVDWLGGWGWGPRYLIPLLPLLMLWVLPVIPRLTTSMRRLAFGGLVALGAGIQFLGMAVPLSNYYTDLFLNNKIYDYALIYSDRAAVDAQWGWMDAIWGWEWSPIRYHLTRLNFSRLDIAWAAVDGWIAPALALSSLLLICVWLYFNIRTNVLISRLMIVVAAILLSLSLRMGLNALSHDPRIVGDYTDVDALVDQLNTAAAYDEAVFIDRHLYTPIFMNAFKPLIPVVTLAYAPGESYDAQGPQVISDDLIEQAGYENVYGLDWFGEQRSSGFDMDNYIWLVTSSSPFEADKRRPIERYLVEHYFPVQEISTSPRARAIRFYMFPAPIGEPANPTVASFGGLLRLTGVDLPLGNVSYPNPDLPLSLVWQPEAAMTMDYNISLFLQNEAGETVWQHDGQPQATFGYTSRWQVGEQYRDNYLVPLSLLPNGIYHLMVAVYNWQDQQRLAVTATQDNAFLVTEMVVR